MYSIVLAVMINKFKNILFYNSLALELGFLYFNLVYWHKSWLGWILLCIYFLFMGSVWQKILKKVFGMKEGELVTRLYAFFSVFLLLSLLSSICVVWYKLTFFMTWLVFVKAVLISVILFLLTHKRKYELRIAHFANIEMSLKTDNFKHLLFKKSFIFSIVFSVLYLTGWYFLTLFTSKEMLNSPWQAINPYFLVIFFLFTITLCLMVFSHHKVMNILLAIILHSILLHAYLPVSHVFPWGGDVWRHIAIEQRLSQGEFYPPVLFGPEAKWREVFKVDLPEALVIPNKYLYGQLWGGTVLLSQTLDVSLVNINKWLLPVLWSVMIPVIFFRIGGLLFFSWRKGLLLALLPTMFFPFQVLGAISLPVSLGYLTFFFVFMLWLQYLRDRDDWQRRIVILLALLMVFGYTMHFLVIWFIIIISHFARKYLGHYKELFESKKKLFKNVLTGILAVVSVLFFPLIELVSGASRFPLRFDFINQLKQFVGQFSGWFYASEIRPHDILSGNIIFNHTPQSAFVSNPFSDFRWPIIPLVVLIWLMVFYAFWQSRKAKLQSIWTVLRMFFLLTVGGYIIVWFMMEGDRSFVRRLDAMIAFLLMIFLLYGFYFLLRKNINNYVLKISFFVVVVAFGWLSAVTYASGPDMRVVSEDEYKAASYVLSKVDLNSDKHCVLADTWVLLVLEGISNQKIVGGGFPIDYQFGQPELGSLYSDMQNAGDENVLSKMHELTGAKCVVVIPQDKLTDQKKLFIQSIMKSETEYIGDFAIWVEGE